MKKLIHLLLCVLIATSFVGCGEAEERETISISQKGKGEATPEKEDPSKEKPETKTPSIPASQGQIDLDDDSNFWVEINGRKFNLKSDITDVMAVGFTTEDADMIIAAEYSTTIELEWNGSYCALLYVRNDSPVEKTAMECKFSGIIISYDEDDVGLNVSTHGGITHGTPLSKVLEVFGESDDVYEGDYYSSYGYTGTEYNGYSFDLVDGKVDSIHMFYW